MKVYLILGEKWGHYGDPEPEVLAVRTDWHEAVQLIENYMEKNRQPLRWPAMESDELLAWFDQNYAEVASESWNVSNDRGLYIRKGQSISIVVHDTEDVMKEKL